MPEDTKAFDQWAVVEGFYEYEVSCGAEFENQRKVSA